MLLVRPLSVVVVLSLCAVVPNTARGDDGERTLKDQQTVVVAEGAAWGVVTPLADGSIGLVYQKAQPLPQVDACNVAMLWVRSVDGGKSWSSPVMVSQRLGRSDALFSPREGGGYVVYQQRNQALGQLPGGRIVCAFCELNYHYDQEGKGVNNPNQDFNHKNQGVVCTWSDDLGKTWAPTEPVRDHPVGGSDGGVAPHWAIVTLSDGAACMSLYGAYNSQYQGDAKIPAGTHKLAGIVRSRDNGKTWGEFTAIFADPGNQLYEETSLCLVGTEKKLLAHMRRPQTDLVQYESSDDGRTWSGPSPLTEAGQQPGGAFQLKSGNLLATWGNRRPPYGAAAMLSTDGGASWHYNNRVLLSGDATSENCGYANGAQAGDGTIMVTYYIMPPSTGNYRKLWTESKVYVTSFTEDQFRQAAGL